MAWAFTAAAVPAAEPMRPAKSGVPPVIDGLLDDEAWRGATQTTAFKTWRPDFGAEPAGQTIVFSTYDARFMYFAFRAFDAEPGKIKASMASRDSIRPDDWICINLDSFNDQQALYSFYVNPLGIQMDGRYAAGQEDLGFDTVWYSAGRIDDQGYTVEVRIPFKSVRYSGRKTVTMGVIFERSVSRSSEGSTYPPLDPKMGMNFNIQMMPIAFEEIEHYTLLEVLPDATYSRRHEARAGSLERSASRGELGFTAKYGITGQLTADGTYNPDFSQVEADAGQIDINLRHPLFFAEKRPFFLEGNEAFNLGGPAQNGVLQSLLHTRTIANPIAGVKVSGKLARADTLAALYAVDEAGAAASGNDRAGFSALRYKRSLRQDAYLGAFYVGREEGAAFNRVGGVDGSLRVSDSAAFGFHAFRSDTRSAGETTGTNGHAVGLDFTRETRRLAAYAAVLDVSGGFEARSGYLTRNGVSQVLASATWRFYPKSAAARRVQVGGATQQTRDAPSRIWETYNEVNASVLLPRATTLTARCRQATEVYLGSEFGSSGCSATGSTQIGKQLRLQGSADHGRAIYYSSEPFGGRSTRATLTVVYQPSEQWYQSLAMTYADFTPAGERARLYDYGIIRSKTTYQVNRYLFFRAILEYNSYRRELVTDFLGSFTYVPGTVIHAGYGSLYEKSRWNGLEYVRGPSFLETGRGLFLKVSYLWRL